MTKSRVTYTGDGQATQFPVPFLYLDKAHVSVTVGGSPVPFSWNSNGFVIITPAPTGEVTIQRTTPSDESIVDFNDGSVLDEELLDKMSLQLFYIAQEILDDAGLAQTRSATALATSAQALSKADQALDFSGTAVETASIAEQKAQAAVNVANAASDLINQAVAGSVVNFNGRSGAVTPQAGDYTKGMVGLDRVDNTSDVEKPLSVAAVNALAGKSNTGHGHVISDVSGLQAALNDKPSLTGANASGNWGINVTGSARSLSNSNWTVNSDGNNMVVSHTNGQNFQFRQDGSIATASLWIDGNQATRFSEWAYQNIIGLNQLNIGVIPPWVRRITLMLFNVSTTGGSRLHLRLGTQSGFVESGYAASASLIGPSSCSSVFITSAFLVDNLTNAVDVRSATVTLNRGAGNRWVLSSVGCLSNTGHTYLAGGSQVLPGPLTTLRLFTSNTTETFDLGEITVLIEG